jgi:predicted nucleotidyltransferase
MTRSAAPALPAAHRRLVLAILGANLPDGVTAWVFGSRATGRARRYSDLDLAIDAGRPLTLDEAARLAEAFSESDLPYRVDLIDWHGIDDRFRQLIAAERVALAEPASADAAIAANPTEFGHGE